MHLLDLTERARPHVPRVPHLPQLGAAARATWTGRMINEHESSHVFEGLARQLAAAGVDPALVAECEAFAEEERTHGALCGAVVMALGGEARARVPAPATLPAHADVEPFEAALRNVLSVCCLSETVAVALIGAERLEMPEGEVKELLTRIFADEVGHARFGWRFLGELAADLSADTRARLRDYLEVAFDHLERHELSHLDARSAPPPEGAALGLCNGRDARELFYATVRTVILPRLEAHGLAATYAWMHRRAAAA